MVTTKRAKSEKIAINVNAFYSTRKVTRVPEHVTDPYTVMKIKHDAATPLYNLYPEKQLEIGKYFSEHPNEDRVVINPDDPESWLYYGSTDWMDEVVVVGYGTQKKVNLSGAVDAISSEALEDRPIINAGQGLQGVIPNLNITISNGAANSTPSFNIRGETSLNGGDPLILVDNIPTTSGELSRLNTNDIESVSVLKDAASAAIYGCLLYTSPSPRDCS